MIIAFYTEELSWKETLHSSSPLKHSFDRVDVSDMGKVTFICRGKKICSPEKWRLLVKFLLQESALQDPGYLRATIAFEISEQEVKLKADCWR